ncbi:cytochrome c peroxidase [Janthinobacterium sp. 17J80-10]|uniref:cytochrome-c peroxidase n=1 Tax=Janthinobacterium sp. 17J80-10 TaxID=2497863 RepID=UPI001005681D|nr:cytochrome c peroxidase [Janthinobacterium sp. 17J80-10]QAU33050.1 cytochrome-c peroxidase [Janthinobacterium sp. 17J80-10]
MHKLTGALLAAGSAALIAGAALAGMPDYIDGWTREEMAILASLSLKQLPPAPKDPSNAYEALPAAVHLGERIFADRRFSSNGAVSCASCHQPDKHFQDGAPLGLGVGTGSRRTMPVVAADHSPFLFWDGRKDSLWSQALGPLEDPAEHGGNRLAYAHLMQAHYRKDYEAIFGAMPDLRHFPKHASPAGTPLHKTTWNTMPESARHDVSRIFANMGKALAAYQKTLQHGESRLDRYVEGVVSGDQPSLQILSPEEKHGLRIFIGKGNCITCHNGPLLTDQHFHNTGVPQRHEKTPDMGRYAAIDKVMNDEFNCLGRYSDAKPELCEELNFIAAADHTTKAAFKTPGLRNVASRPPYMHAGQLASLEDVVRHYANAPASAAGHSELKPINLSEQEVRDVIAFLHTLSSPIVQRQ